MHSRKYLNSNINLLLNIFNVFLNSLPPIEAIMEILVSKADPAAG